MKEVKYRIYRYRNGKKDNYSSCSSEEEAVNLAKRLCEEHNATYVITGYTIEEFYVSMNIVEPQNGQLVVSNG